AIAAETGTENQPLEKPSYELPGHPVVGGARFSQASAELREMGNWYGNAASVLEELAGGDATASPVRCWPHHFDIATPFSLSGARTVGGGPPPGDASYAEPYWYVGPSPRPKETNLPPLPEKGRWHTEGFFAAVLTGSDLLAGGRERQRERSETFLRAAIAA